MFYGRKFEMTRVSKLYFLKETYSAELRFFTFVENVTLMQYFLLLSNSSHFFK